MLNLWSEHSCPPLKRSRLDVGARSRLQGGLWHPPDTTISLLLVVHDYFVEGFAIFVRSVHSESRSFPVFRQHRLTLSRPAIEVPGVLDGVSVNFFTRTVTLSLPVIFTASPSTGL